MVSSTATRYNPGPSPKKRGGGRPKILYRNRSLIELHRHPCPWLPGRPHGPASRCAAGVTGMVGTPFPSCPISGPEPPICKSVGGEPLVNALLCCDLCTLSSNIQRRCPRLFCCPGTEYILQYGVHTMPPPRADLADLELGLALPSKYQLAGLAGVPACLALPPIKTADLSPSIRGRRALPRRARPSPTQWKAHRPNHQPVKRLP